MEKASELEFLRWYFANADFGPAHDDVVDILMSQFQEETGMALPDGYGFDEEDY